MSNFDFNLKKKRARPEYSKRVYSLMTSFPNKEIVCTQSCDCQNSTAQWLI
jgi:hypothetical protein